MKKLVIVNGLISLLFACINPSNKNEKDVSEKNISSDLSSQTTCPFLTNDNAGNIVMSYIKEKNDTSAVMCYAVSKDKGRSFDEPIEIPASKYVLPSSENLPKIAFKPNGEIIVVWGVNNASPKKKYAGLIYYSQSFDNGKNWNEARLLVNDTASIDQRYFDVVVLQNGEVGIIWLDSRSKTDKQGSTLYFASTNGKNGFINEKPIGETICQCCRTDLFVDDKGVIHAVYRDIINDSIRDMVHIASANEGKTFSLPKRISDDNWVINGCPHTGPTMTENSTGLHFAWYTMGGGSGVFYSNTINKGKSFSMRDSVSGKSSAKHPQITSLPNGDIIIVWDEMIKKGEHFNACIGLQHRSGQGKVISTRYITSDDFVVGYPVIKAVDNNVVVVAWVQQETAKQKNLKQEQVFYKRFTIE
jgi:hypothetical protein